MNENTAQNNNVQFNYPDFSNAPNTPTPSSSSVTTNDEEAKKIKELEKNLANLMNEDKVVESPTSEPEATPAQFQPVTEEKQITEEAEKIEKDTYIQEPTSIPGLQEEVSSADISDIALHIETPTKDEFDPLPSDLPKFRETLDNIMPDPNKKPKAMERNPKAENLSKPVERSPIRKNSIKGDDIKVEDTSKKEDSPKPIIVNGELTMEKLLAEAVNRNASDLHLAVGYPPILRIDGELIDLDEKVLNPEDAEQLIFSVLTDERKELLEVNREIDFAYTLQAMNNARFRINAYYSMRNLSAAFRLIPSRVRTIEELMLPQLYHQFSKLKQGLILVTGPTGHGKSTTLAAILEDINRTRFCHIVTIEDPVEYVFEGKKALIDQREMNDDTHSWNIALRSALRQDPDVILVGEMRDFETIAAAITLAETGHLVFATLHTNSASQTLDRIIDVFPENQQQQVRTQIANTLEAVIAQRLIPLDKGGRRAVSEIMLNNSAISNLIREGKMHQVDNVIRTSSDIGMVYLEKSLVGLVREGVISVQKAQEYAVHPEEVLRLLKM
jgi:twitching motility protein PilT